GGGHGGFTDVQFGLGLIILRAGNLALIKQVVNAAELRLRQLETCFAVIQPQLEIGRIQTRQNGALFDHLARLGWQADQFTIHPERQRGALGGLYLRRKTSELAMANRADLMEFGRIGSYRSKGFSVVTAAWQQSQQGNSEHKQMACR